MDNWIIKESDHYIFHYHKNSIAENMIDDIVEEQEDCFNHISRVLKINFNIKINYYLCNSAEEVGALYGDNDPCNAFARKNLIIYLLFLMKMLNVLVIMRIHTFYLIQLQHHNKYL
ncbi:hypothetical protein Q5M85_18660 [Paraclostridium bifermentans]|nr:hypothetical protein [Paraclostridium bifermentans]